MPVNCKYIGGKVGGVWKHTQNDGRRAEKTGIGAAGESKGFMWSEMYPSKKDRQTKALKMHSLERSAWENKHRVDNRGDAHALK